MAVALDLTQEEAIGGRFTSSVRVSEWGLVYSSLLFVEETGAPRRLPPLVYAGARAPENLFILYIAFVTFHVSCRVFR